METKEGWLGDYFHFGVQPYFQEFSYFVVTNIKHPGHPKITTRYKNARPKWDFSLQNQEALESHHVFSNAAGECLKPLQGSIDKTCSAL